MLVVTSVLKLMTSRHAAINNSCTLSTFLFPFQTHQEFSVLLHFPSENEENMLTLTTKTQIMCNLLVNKDALQLTSTLTYFGDSSLT